MRYDRTGRKVQAGRLPCFITRFFTRNLEVEMVKLAMIGLTVVVAVAGCLAFSGDSAQARPAYKKLFKKKYVTDDYPAMKKAYGHFGSCNYCHIGGIKVRRSRARRTRSAAG